MQKLLLTGGSGLLGTNFTYLSKDKYEIYSIYNNNKIEGEGFQCFKFDYLYTANPFEDILNDIRPDIIIHAGALVNVDLCEENKDLAYKLNLEWTKTIINSINKIGIGKVVFISSDQLFDGENGPYNEKDTPKPLNTYAATKLMAEQYIIENMADYLILRVNFFGFGISVKQSFGEWILDALKNKKDIFGIYDVKFSPLLINTFVNCINAAIESNLNGLYHVGTRDSVSKYDFIKHFYKSFNVTSANVVKKKAVEFSFSARRPANMTLDSSKLFNILNIEHPSVETEIKKFVRLYKEGYKEKLRKTFINY